MRHLARYFPPLQDLGLLLQVPLRVRLRNGFLSPNAGADNYHDHRHFNLHYNDRYINDTDFRDVHRDHEHSHDEDHLVISKHPSHHNLNHNPPPRCRHSV
mmetsp:Transcript_157011/g.381431  ORF Transcript_157011/g.381431 Transcript_157011/m.381431 type:complete len:100 (+) Transcript_157011:836-1135(+)